MGIPVGNLTSQLFANVYGNKLDKFCKHVLHIPYFVRYMDDFIILSDDLEQLKEWVKRIEEFLENEMLLHINPKSTILYAGNGIDFCGYIHYADPVSYTHLTSSSGANCTYALFCYKL